MLDRDEFHHIWHPSAEHPPSHVVVVLHGNGGDEQALVPLARTLDPAAAILSPCGKCIENGQARFFARRSAGPPVIVDEADLLRRTDELADWIAKCSAQYGFPMSSVSVAGFSNGATMAGSLLVLRPDVIRRAVLFRPMMLPAGILPDPPPSLEHSVAYVSAGQADDTTPPELAEKLAEYLSYCGAKTRVEIDPGGHQMGMAAIRPAIAWLREHVKAS